MSLTKSAVTCVEKRFDIQHLSGVAKRVFMSSSSRTSDGKSSFFRGDSAGTKPGIGSGAYQAEVSRRV